jgi:diaminopimelate epimerase
MKSSPHLNKWVFNFLKFEASGNDFITVDDSDETFPLSDSSFIARICDRKRGIGADGLLLIQPSQKVDCRMRIFNADGLEAPLCGNGLRIIATHLLNGSLKDTLHIETKSGVFKAHKKEGGVWVFFSMPKYLGTYSVSLLGHESKGHLIDAGALHLLIEDPHLKKYEDLHFLAELRQKFDANVSLFAVKSKIGSIRTYERGVEGETASCGTASISLASLYPGELLEIHYPKDRLEISYEEEGIGLHGLVNFSFSGIYYGEKGIIQI